MSLRDSEITREYKENILEDILNRTYKNVRKKIKEEYNIENPSRELIIVKSIELQMFRELPDPESSKAYKSISKKLDVLVEQERNSKG